MFNLLLALPQVARTPINVIAGAVAVGILAAVRLVKNSLLYSVEIVKLLLSTAGELFKIGVQGLSWLYKSSLYAKLLEYYGLDQWIAIHYG